MTIRTFFQLTRLVATVNWYALLVLPSLLKTRLAKSGDYGVFDKRGREFSADLLRIAGVRCEIEGLERLREDESYVFVANHASMFDIPAVWFAVSARCAIRMMYKRELQHLPLFGWAMRLSPFIPIKREKARDGMASVNAAIEAIRKNSSVLVFAEGTRSRDGKLRAFKRGAFMLAARSQKPIVPVAIVGSHRIMRSDSFNLNQGIIRVVIGEPVRQPDRAAEASADYAANEKTIEKALMQEIHARIAAMLPEEQRF